MKMGMTFKYNQVQQAVCAPSRASALCGLRPDSTATWDLWHYFRTRIWERYDYNVTTLPQAFKDKGWRVGGSGKLFHPGHASGEGVTGPGDDYPISWTEPYFHAPARHDYPWNDTSARSWIDLDKPEDQFPDAQIVQNSIQQIRQFTEDNADQPWFVGTGLHKPHLPFVAPKKYYDMYPLDSIHPATNSYVPKNLPTIEWSDWGELRNYDDIAALNLSKAEANDMPDAEAVLLRRGYYAATSFTDNQLGVLLDALEAQGHLNNTIIAFTGDHGWDLGNHAHWTKHTNWASNTGAPLIVVSPDHPQSHGVISEALTESVDIYPTLLDLAGYPIPTRLEGFSLRPLLEKPSAGEGWKQAAFSQYPRDTTRGTHKDENYPHAMGYKVTTHNFTYTRWMKFDNATATRHFDEVLGEELYDHRGDIGLSPQRFEDYENVNVVDDPQFASDLARLRDLLKANWNGTDVVPKWAVDNHNQRQLELGSPETVWATP